MWERQKMPEKWQAGGCVNGAVSRRLFAEKAAGIVQTADFHVATRAYVRFCVAQPNRLAILIVERFT